MASLAIHFCLALFVVMPRSAGHDQSVERITFVRVPQIEIAPRAAAKPAGARARTHLVAVPKTTSVAKASHKPARRAAHKSKAPASTLSGTAVAMGESQAGVANPGPSTAPVIVSTPTPQPPAEPPDRQAGGYMPFGAQEDEPVLDARVLAQLQHLNVHVTLVVAVDDTGRTTAVDFRPQIDPQLESQIQALLANANWDPAYCGGGVPCAKTATITL